MKSQSLIDHAFQSGVNYYTKTISENNKKYSIDIIFSLIDINSNSLVITNPNDINFNTDLLIPNDSSPTMSNSIGNIIDISQAHLIDSDFESGIFERLKKMPRNEDPAVDYGRLPFLMKLLHRQTMFILIFVIEFFI